MTRSRGGLPQLGPSVFLTDSGVETELLYNQGVDLPWFAAFPLLTNSEGTQRLRMYYRTHAAIAARADVGFVLETVTWRASAEWGALLGFDAQALDEANRMAVDLLVEVREEFSDSDHPYPISGCLGPRRDGYRPELQVTVEAAATYHRPQIETLADTEADLVTALTLSCPTEAIGIAVAAHDAGMPVVLSFTVETDGRLADGMTLAAAIRHVDEATDAYPAYYMINCAHPSHFGSALDPDAPWTRRIRGIRANASSRSHAELESATELDSGDPVAFGHDYADIRSRFPHLTVLGGCCGTDLRHIQQVAWTCL